MIQYGKVKDRRYQFEALLKIHTGHRGTWDEFVEAYCKEEE